MSMKQFAILASLSLSLLAPPLASSHAATSTAAVAVSATVSSFCQVGTPIAPSDRAGLDGRTRSLAVSCELKTPYHVTYDDGAADAATGGSGAVPMGRVAATITY